MNAPSAYIDAYSENKVLYRKTTVNGVEVLNIQIILRMFYIMLSLVY